VLPKTEGAGALVPKGDGAGALPPNGLLCPKPPLDDCIDPKLFEVAPNPPVGFPSSPSIMEFPNDALFADWPNGELEVAAPNGDGFVDACWPKGL
jgi:hypothetical protein